MVTYIQCLVVFFVCVNQISRWLWTFEQYKQWCAMLSGQSVQFSKQRHYMMHQGNRSQCHMVAYWTKTLYSKSTGSYIEHKNVEICLIVYNNSNIQFVKSFRRELYYVIFLSYMFLLFLMSSLKTLVKCWPNQPFYDDIT